MAVVDNLEIQIKSEASNAIKELDKLIGRIGEFSNAIKSINVGNISSQVSKLTTSFKDINSNGFSEVSRAAKEAHQSVTKLNGAIPKNIKSKVFIDTSDWTGTIDKLRDSFGNIGGNLKFSGNLKEIENEIKATLTSIYAAEKKEAEITSAKKLNVGELIDVEKTIARLQNKFGALTELRDKTKELHQNLSKLQVPEIRENNLEKLQNQLEKAKQKMAFLKTELQNKLTMGKITASIDDSGYVHMREQIALTGKTISALQDRIKVFSDASEKVNSLGNRIEELKSHINNLQSQGFKAGDVEFDKAAAALQRAEQELKQYKAILAQPSKGLQEDIQKTNSLGNHVEELKKKLDELKSRGLNFGDKEFDKAYSELQKVESELLKYKLSLDSTQKSSISFSDKTSQAFKKVGSVLKNMVSGAVSALGRLGSALALNRKNLSNLTSGMSSFRGTTSKTVSSVGSLTKQVAAASGVYLGLYGAIKGIKSSIDFASSLTEVQNVINVTFGKSAKVIEDFAKTSIRQFGLSELSAKQTAGRYQAMGTALGVPQKEMAKMSVELTKLSADMASFYDVAQEDVAKSLQSVFTGTTTPMRRYGVDLTIATLEEWAHKRGIDAKIKSMSQAEKMMLRYQYVMERTGAAQGDFQRTIHTWHNQITLLKENFRELSGVIGTAFINTLKPVIETLNAVMGKVIAFSKTVLNSLGQIFGWEYEDTGGGVANDFMDEMEGAGDLADGMDDVADATDEATKKQKEFNKQLAKFDELTNYTTSEKGGGKDKDNGKDSTGLDDLAGLGGEYGGGEWKKKDSIFKKFKSELDTLYKLGEYIGNTLTEVMEGINWDSIYEKARNFGSGLASFLNGLISPGLFSALGKTVAGSINTAINAALGFGENFNFDNFGTSIASFINSALGGIDWGTALTAATTWGTGIATAINSFIKETDFELVGSSVASFVNTAIQGALSFTKNFNFKGVGKSIATALNSFIKKTDFNDIGKLIASFVNGAAKTALSIAKNFNFKGVGKSIATFINSSLGNIKWKSILTAASAWGKGISETINSFFKETDFKLIGSTVGNFINTAINSALSSGKELNFANIGQKIADGINRAFATINFSGLAESINTWVKGALTAVTTLLQKTDFEAIGQKIGTFLAELDILSMMGKFAQMLWEAIKSGFSLLGGLIQEAPLETALIAAFGIMKFSGLGTVVGGAISKALVSNLAQKLGVEMAANQTISSVMTTALSQKLEAPIQTVTNKIGGIATAVGVAAGSFLEFETVSGVFDNIITGNDNLLLGIGKIAGVVGAAALAMNAALGPAGIAIAAIVGLVGAIKGINDGLEEIKAEETANNIKEAFANPGGIPISELAGSFADSIKIIGNGFDEVSEKSNKLDTAEKNIEDIKFQIQLVQEQLDAGTITAEEAQEKLTSLLTELDKAVQDKFSSINEYIVSAFGENGAWAKSFESAGVDVSNMVSTTLGLTADLQERFTQITKEMSELDPTSPKYKELQEEMYGIIGGTDELKEAFNKFDTTISSMNVDYSGLLTDEGELDPSAVEETMGKISTAVSDTQKDIDVAGGKLKTQLEELIDKAKLEKNQEAVDYYEEILKHLPEIISDQKLAVAEKGKEFTDTLQSQLIDKAKEVVQKAQEEWTELNPVEQFAAGSEARYVGDAIERYQKNYIDPITSEIESSFSELGLEGAGWGEATGKTIMDSLFITQSTGVFHQTETVVKGDLNSVFDGIKKELVPVAKNTGKEITQTMSDNIPEGVDEKKAEKSTKKLTDKAAGSIDKKKLKKAGKEGGKALSDGMPEGVDTKQAQKAGKKVADEVTDKAIKEIKLKSKDIGSQAVNSTVTGLDENWSKVDDWWKKTEMPKIEFKIGNIKEKVSAKWKEVADWWGEIRKLKVDISFITDNNNVSSWWKKIKEWWGTKKLEVSNSFKTLQSDVSKWWDSIKKWWGTKKLEVSNKLTTQKNEVTSWWTDKVKSWWGERKVKVSTEYTTKETTVNSWGKNTVKWLKEGISGAWGDFSEWVVKKIKSVINQVVKGLNWVLGQVGSNKRINQYAKGSSGLPQDTIGLVNDQKGNTYREMIVPPHGKPFIPKGRNVTLPMEKGTKIMPAKQTKEFMQGMKNIPRFAKGTGGFTGAIFDYFDKPKEIIKIATDKFLDFSGLAKASLSVAKGIAKTLEDGAVGFVKKAFDSVGGAGIERAISWALKIASDDSHGYDQNSRWGTPDYDCSSFVISAFEQAGIKLKSAGATYTGDMRGAALKTGFSDVTKSVNLSSGGGLKRGDILLDAGRHVALYLGDGQLVHASINENGGITGGQPGDQTGREITTRGYYNHPWSSILRYTGKSDNKFANGIGKINLSDIIKGFAKGGISKNELGVVNDQPGNTYKELIIPPHGKPFIPEGRNVTLAMEKGTRIIPADKTKKFLNKLPHFANGTEDFNGEKKSNGGNSIADSLSRAINDTLIPYVREIIRALNNGGGTTVSTSGKKTTTKYSDTVKEIQKAWTGLAKWFESTVVEPIEKGFDTLKEKLAEIFTVTNEELIQKYTEISSEWQNTLKEVPEWIKENAWEAISYSFEEFCSDITEVLKGTWENAQGIMSSIPEWVENSVASPFYEKFSNAFQNILEEHQRMWSGIETYSDTVIGRINSSTEASFRNISNLVSELERRLDGITAEIETVREDINETANKVSETKKQTEEITGQTSIKILGFKGEAEKSNKNTSTLGTFQDLNKSMVQEFTTIPKEVNNFVQNVSRPIENLTNNVKDAVERLKAASQGKVKRYAAGGFPEDGWFRASKGEFMGQFDDGTSYIANNNQIQQAISAEVGGAVYNAVMAAIASSGGNGGDIIVQIDGENIFRAVRNKDQDFYKRNHKGAFEH